MDKKARSIDGIILRPSGKFPRRNIGDIPIKDERVTLDNVSSRNLYDKSIDNSIKTDLTKKQLRNLKKNNANKQTLDGIEDDPFGDDISDSLHELNEDIHSDYLEVPDKSSKEKKLKKINKAKKTKEKPTKRKKVIRGIIIAVVLAILAVGGFFAYKIFIAGDNIFDGNFIDLFKYEKLQEDKNGRTNILVFGTTPATDKDGPMLADSIMVVSINQTTKDAYTISLPRDLYVEHYCPNLLMNTTAGKLNETYKCVYSKDNDNETEAGNEFRKIAGRVLGIDIQYFAHVQYKGVIAMIDSVGGIDVKIESDDPRGIYDYNTGVKYANGEIAHLDGKKALKLARARGEGGGYGLSGGNYFRERMQQKILQALQAKALSTGTLSNPVVALNILTALGNNLRTNFKTSEVRSLINIANEFKSDDIISVPLKDYKNNVNLITSSMINSASVELPVAGTFNYSEIHKYIEKKLTSNPVTREAAVIDVLNGSKKIGLAKTKADELEAKNFVIGIVDNAPKGKYETVEIFQLNSKKTATAKALKEKFGVDLKTKSDLPKGVLKTADFVIIFGEE